MNASKSAAHADRNLLERKFNVFIRLNQFSPTIWWNYDYEFEKRGNTSVPDFLSILGSISKPLLIDGASETVVILTWFEQQNLSETKTR